MFIREKEGEAFANCLKFYFFPIEDPDDNINWEKDFGNAYDYIIRRIDAPNIRASCSALFLDLEEIFDKDRHEGPI